MQNPHERPPRDADLDTLLEFGVRRAFLMPPVWCDPSVLARVARTRTIRVPDDVPRLELALQYWRKVIDGAQAAGGRNSDCSSNGNKDDDDNVDDADATEDDAADTFFPAMTIELAAGTHETDHTWRMRTRHTKGDNYLRVARPGLTVRGDGAATTTILGAGFHARGAAASDFHLAGVTVSNCDRRHAQQERYRGHGLLVDAGARSVVAVGCIFAGCGGSGVCAVGVGSSITLKHTRCERNALSGVLAMGGGRVDAMAGCTSQENGHYNWEATEKGMVALHFALPDPPAFSGERVLSCFRHPYKLHQRAFRIGVGGRIVIDAGSSASREWVPPRYTCANDNNSEMGNEKEDIEFEHVHSASQAHRRNPDLGGSSTYLQERILQMRITFCTGNRLYIQDR